VTRAIHQFVAGFSRGDAISNEALVLRDIFRSWGYPSEIFSETSRILPELRRDVNDVQSGRDTFSPDDLVLLHLSIGSIVNTVFAELPVRKALLYHNITPPELLKGLQPQSARNAERGLEQARKLAGVATVNLAVSRFNAQELEAMGYQNVGVLPLILDLDALSRRIDRKARRRLSDGLTNILFVGRCVPNKRIEDLLGAFYYYQQYVNPESRLIHAGSFTGTESYHAFLLTLAHENGIRNTEMPGSIPQPELNALFDSADLFLCMSEHEGFCIPLLEAMARGVPVMAYDAGAIAETLDGAGILFREKQFHLIAEMMGRVTGDGEFRRRIIEGQNQRINRYKTRNLEHELRNHLSPLL
jgi:glycosyltransferase involved in cell wall biosynthesis